MHVVILTRQIGHYHDARFSGAAEHIENLTVLSTANEGGFKQFLAKPTGLYPIEKLYDCKADYDAAIAEGRIIADMADRLVTLAPDVLVVSGWAGAESFAGILWARKNLCPIVIMSESQIFDAPRSALRERIKKRIVNHANAALVGGQTHADYLRALGFNTQAISFGYNAVGNDTYILAADKARKNGARHRKELHLPKSYLLASARFIPKKNLTRLVSAFAKAYRASPTPTDLVILGDGELRSEIETQIKADNMGRHIHLHGFRGIDSLPAYYGLADGFVHISLTEQWGLVVNEAMAASLPVIVSKPCGVTNILEDGKNGFLIDPRNADSITEALMTLFALSPSERKAIGRFNRETIQNWGSDKYGQGLKQAIITAHSQFRPKPLMPWDAALLRRMSKRSLSDVS